MRTSFILTLAALACCAGCVHVDTRDEPERTETRVIQRQGAEQVDVEIAMGAGKVQVRGGAKELLEADLRFAPESWRPEIRYDVSGFRGRLSVRHPQHAGVAAHTIADWNLRLNNDTPMNVHVKLGAGESQLSLGDLTLRNLGVEVGAGKLELDLAGKPKKTMDVKVRGGVGEVRVRLPRDVGVEVEAHGGIGEIRAEGFHKRGSRYLNQKAEDGGNVGIRVDVRGGIGAIHLVGE